MTQCKDDPRLADTGHFAVGREIIDATCLVEQYERILELGESCERGEVDPSECDSSAITELTRFIDRHARQLLWLAKKGALQRL
jgi:hypothetical protein